MKLFQFFTIAFVLATNPYSWAETESNPNVEGQTSTALQATKAPAGNVFLSYNYFHYQMAGHSAANNNIYKFGESSVDLSLLTATWLYSSNWTLIAMLPHVTNRVETIYEPTPTGMNFKTIDTTRGVSDLRLMAMTPVSIDPAHLTLLDIGVTAPTGSINEYFTSKPTQRASYNMQPGSGTPDLILGATVTNTMGVLVSSARGQATLRGGKNANGYALGNEFIGKLSSIYTINSYFSSGVVGNYRIRGAVQGRDEKYEISNNYNNPDSGIAGDGHQFYHATQQNWDANLIAKAHTPSFGVIHGTLEVGVPFAQGNENKDDIDLKINYYAAASLNASF